MDLPFSLIREKLDICCKIKDFRASDPGFFLSRPMMHYPDIPFHMDNLYMVLDPDTEAVTLPEEGHYLIPEECTCKIDNYQNLQNYILLAKTENPYVVFNKTYEIFALYDQWERNVNNLLIRAGSVHDFKSLMDLAEQIFENPVSLVSSHYQVIAMSSFAEEEELYRQANKYGSLVPDAVIERFRNNRQFQEFYHSSIPYILSDDYFPFRGLTKNLLKDGKMQYRIIVSETHRPFSDSDFLLLEIFAGSVRLLIDKLDISEDLHGNALGKQFRTLAETGQCDPRILKEELTDRGWPQKDRYSVVYIEPDKTDITIMVLQRIAGQLSKLVPDSESFVSDDSIGLVIHIGRQEIQTYLAAGPLTDFIRENRFRAGLSNIFCDMLQMQVYFRQAELALRLGSMLAPAERIHNFSDYALPYIYDRATREYEAEELFSPVYLRLQKYDEINHTEYLKTLECYLQHHMNASKTAESLIIHRATIIFRIKRICEIGQTDLKNPDVLLHLAFSFYMKHMQKRASRSWRFRQ